MDYNSDEVVADYLLFHYGAAERICPFPDRPAGTGEFHARLVREFCIPSSIASYGNRRALDLGCGVGRASFELAALYEEVVGVDLSEKFIAASRKILNEGRMDVNVREEGGRFSTVRIEAPRVVNEIRFEVGDAKNISDNLGAFDCILAANLLDRVPHPSACLHEMRKRLRPAGRLVISSPYTWLESSAAPSEWLCGAEGDQASTRERIGSLLGDDYSMLQSGDLPFLIREHRRKYQWCVAEVTVWARNVR